MKADGEQVKQINPTERVRAKKFLGSGTFGTCHLAHYRGILIAVKDFKSRRSRSDKVKRDVFNKARMISHQGDHHGLPLLFGVIMKSTPFCIVTQFHRGQDTKFNSLQGHEKMRVGQATLALHLKRRHQGPQPCPQQGHFAQRLKVKQCFAQKTWERF